MLNEGNFILCLWELYLVVIPFYYGSGSDSGTVINYGSGSDFLASYGSGSTTLVKRPYLKPLLLSRAERLNLLPNPQENENEAAHCVLSTLCGYIYLYLVFRGWKAGELNFRSTEQTGNILQHF